MKSSRLPERRCPCLSGNQLGYLSSYCHRGKYYTLLDIPAFDANGLRSFDSVRFSQHGTLVKTVKGSSFWANPDGLSSPIMIRIHFDILWTVVADTLYRLFARALKRFESKQAPTLFRQFVNMPGVVVYDGRNFTVRIRKRATTPILMGIEKPDREIQITWLENRKLKIVWTA